MEQSEFNLNNNFLNDLKNNKDGLTCPCCNRFAKIYKRRLHATIASQLIKLYKLGGANNYIHTKHLVVGSGISDFSKAKYWGLIEANPELPTDGKKTNGTWRLTNKGVNFIKGNSTISKYILIYQDAPLGESSESVNIYDVLEDKFNYQQLMADC